jgi:transposase
LFLNGVTFLAMDQRGDMKYCFKLGKQPIEIYEMLQTVCGGEASRRNSVVEWFKRYKDGREDLQDDPSSGRPRNADIIANIREMVT